MSLILEALKKAERQHRLGEVPGIGSSPMVESHGPKRGRTGLLLLGVALGMLLLGFYLGRPLPQSRPVQGPEVPSLAPSPPVPPLESPGVLPSRPETPPVARPEPEPRAFAHPPIPAPSTQPPLSEPVVEVEAAPMAADPAPLLSTEPPPMPKQMSELPDGFVSNMPKLNIDIHSFDERPGRSYVLINMEKYREGEYLAEGPLLYEILQEGVILEYMGERFILPIGNY